ncbi:MAG: cytochrome c oxidase subunit 3 [Deltaproteobacteria bacterium]|nr:cytochrome c oxidase subunit 3 [Deltaproteobacteria bacterium]
MSGRNVITLDQSRRARKTFPEEGIVRLLVFLIFDAMIVTGMVGAFVLTRAATGATWPPAGQPWFSHVQTAINSAALLLSGVFVFLAARTWERQEGRIGLLLSGVFVFLAARTWEKQQGRIGPLLLTAIMLGIFFVFFQGVMWVSLIRQGLTLSSSQHGNLFLLVTATHVAHIVTAVIFMSTAWLRLKPFRDDDDQPRGSLTTSTFLAARLLWYFTVAVWPPLYLCLYL